MKKFPLTSVVNSRQLVFSPCITSTRFYSVPRQSHKNTLSPNVAKSKYKPRPRPSQRTRQSTYLPTGSSSVTSPVGTSKFSVLHEMDRKSRESHSNLLSKVDNFDALKIESSIRDTIIDTLLPDVENVKPTPIQTLAIKAIQARRKNPLQQHTFLMAAETGSGKTIAYLAPLLSKLKEDKLTEEYQASKDVPGVRAVILLPSMELITQVNRIVCDLKRSGNFSCLACLPNMPMKKIHSRILDGVDILICTPDKLALLSRNNTLQGHQYLQLCKYLVIDEADSLLNDSFREATLSSIEFMPNLLDLIFCTATIPRQFDRILRERFPDAIRLVTPKIHKLPSHVDFRVIEVFRPPYMDNKMLALKQALFAIYHDGTEDGLTKRVIVFVNRKESVRPIVEELNTDGFVAKGMEGSISPVDRLELVKDFITPAKSLEESAGTKLQILVTTDLMARGIDTKRIRNIVLYDLPLSSADLIHRAGRTGRIGTRGRVLLLVNKKESQGWVKGLEKAVRKGLALA